MGAWGNISVNRLRRSQKATSSDTSSLTVEQGVLMAVIFVAFALTVQAAQPAWWTAAGGPIDGNPSNDFAIANQGQLKLFTQKAVIYLDANLSNGAGTNLDSMVAGWSNYYQTNGYSSTNPAPADFKSVNQGQLKYIGSLIYGRLIAQGVVTGYPLWIQGTNASDYKAANLAQLKTVFNFDLTSYALSPHITSATNASASVGVAMSSYTITANNSPTSYSVTGLLPGLSVNTGTGVITGTPTAAGVYSLILSATNASGTGYATLTLTVNPAPPIILSATNASGVAGSSFYYAILASESPTNYAAATLPSGLTLNTNTGVINGVPAGASTNSIVLSASNAGGTGTNSLLMAIAYPPAPVITSGTNITGNINAPFGYTVNVLNNPTNITLTGTLPAGLSLNTNSGVISGTPTALGSSTGTLNASNAGGSATPVNLTVTITPAGSPVITSGSTAYAFNGTPFSGYTITGTNTPTSYSAIGLPTGLSVNSSTGAITGTPTGYTGLSTVAATISGSNSLGTGSAPLNFTMNLPAPSVTSATTTGYAGTSFIYQVTASNNPTNFTATNLPPGLKIDPNAGVISGTPTVPTSTPALVTLGATNPGGTGTGTLTLTIGIPGPAPVISSGSLVSGILGSPFSYTITTSTLPGSSPTTFGYSGTLPTGLSLNTTTGTISGTLTATGTAVLTLSASNMWGTGYAPLTIIVNPAMAPLITSTNAATGTNGAAFSYTITATNSVSAGGYSASALPAGLGVNNSSGVISGTPTVQGTSIATLGATNSLGAAVAPLTITINPPTPAITSATSASGTFGVAINPFTVTANNGATNFAASGLPPGLQIDATTGIIAGTPTAAGAFTVTVSGTNVTGSGGGTLNFSVSPWSGLPIATRSVADGWYHSLVLKSDGTVWAAGEGFDGQLGNNGNASSPSYTQVIGLPSAIVAISGGGYHSLALANNGAVYAWGFNKQGQLGNNTVTNSYVPVQVSGLSGVTAIAGGPLISMALGTDTTVWTWGYGYWGQLGNGTYTNSDVPVHVQISGGSALSGIVAIAVGRTHALAVKNDGTVWAWGNNDQDELGSNPGTSSNIAVQVPGVNGAVAVAAGYGFSFALINDGSVWAWGDNSGGFLGLGTTGGTSGPVLVPSLTGIVALNAGSSYHSLALKNDGTVWAWGYGTLGALGNGTTTDSNVPIQVPNLTGVIASGVGDYHNTVLRNDGSVWGWGENDEISDIGASGTATQVNLPNSVASPVTFTKITSAAGHSLALASNQTVWTWNDITPGEFGNGTTIVGSTTPVQVAGLSGISDIACGGWFNLAVQGTGSSSTIVAWGQNDDGQLGNGTTTDSQTPQTVTVSGGSALTNIKSIASGGYFAMALKNDGSVWTWGDNSSGELGNSSTNAISTVAVPGPTGVSSIAAGSEHAMAITTTGTILTWGFNAMGELGNGTPVGNGSFTNTPTQVIALTGTYTSIAGGYYHSMALKSDGTVWSWGANLDGELGNGTGTNTATPTQVPSLSGMTNISVGEDSFHSAALKNDGTLWTWGDNNNGQLGVGQYGPCGTNASPTGSQVPVQVLGLAGANITQVAAGKYSMVALKSDGTVTQWGDYTYEPVAFSIPIPVANLNATPGVVITPSAGSYAGSQTVSLFTSLTGSGTSIHYTVDGTEPSTNSPSYTGTFSVTSSALVSAAFFNADGSFGSPVANAQFYINDTQHTGLPTLATNLVVTPASTHELDVSWMLSGMTNYYRVNLYRSFDGTNYPLIATMPPTNAYADTDLQSGTNYTYYVGTLNASGQTNSATSSPVAPFTVTNMSVFVTNPPGVTNLP